VPRAARRATALPTSCRPVECPAGSRNALNMPASQAALQPVECEDNAAREDFLGGWLDERCPPSLVFVRAPMVLNAPSTSGCGNARGRVARICPQWAALFVKAEPSMRLGT